MACDYKAVLTAVDNNIYIVPKFMSKRAYAICIFIFGYVSNTKHVVSRISDL